MFGCMCQVECFAVIYSCSFKARECLRDAVRSIEDGAYATANSIVDSLASISVGVIFTMLLYMIALSAKLIKRRHKQ